MNGFILNGSMRGNSEKCAAYSDSHYIIYPTLPNYCPDCDYSHNRKLWYRRGPYVYCHKCGYRLKPKDYWLSEFSAGDDEIIDG